MKAFFLVLVLSGSLHAQSKAEVLSHAVLIAGGALDFATTRWAISKGAHEANPFAGQRASSQAIAMGVATAGLEALSVACAKDGHPVMARNFRFVIGGMHLGLAGWNTHVGFTLKKRLR